MYENSKNLKNYKLSVLFFKKKFNKFYNGIEILISM